MEQVEVGDCRPEPLIFLRYDFGLNLDNTVPAGRPHTITITGYYQERLNDPPQVTDLQVEVSYQGEDTWHEVQTGRLDEGSVTVTILHPDAEAVGLRITGWDDEDNKVVQTIPKAYGLS